MKQKLSMEDVLMCVMKGGIEMPLLDGFLVISTNVRKLQGETFQAGARKRTGNLHICDEKRVRIHHKSAAICTEVKERSPHLSCLPKITRFFFLSFFITRLFIRCVLLGPASFLRGQTK